MLRALTVLLACQAVSEMASRALHLPVSGTALGMVLLFTALCAMRRVPEDLQQTTDRLMEALPMLFVPACVAVIAYGSLLRREWLPLGAALLGSTIVTFIVTWVTMALVHRMLDAGRREARPR